MSMDRGNVPPSWLLIGLVLLAIAYFGYRIWLETGVV